MIKKEDRFILVEIFKDDSTKTIIGNFDNICKEIEYQVNKTENDEFKAKKIVVYDRKYSDNDLNLNCYYEVENRILYSQFIDSYYLDEEL
jgi:hypothetical protein